MCIEGDHIGTYQKLAVYATNPDTKSFRDGDSLLWESVTVVGGDSPLILEAPSDESFCAVHFQGHIKVEIIADLT